MPTFHECLMAYRARPDAVELSKTKLRRLAHYLAINFDKHRRPGYKQQYVDSHEGGRTIKVRDYPRSYLPTINNLLLKLHNAAAPPPQQQPSPTLRVRKRIPIKQKPVWSPFKR